MITKLISADKLLDWIENHPDADGFWNGEKSIAASDALEDAIHSGILGPDDPNQIKVGDSVIIAPDARGIITDIQHVHDRYQLRGISGWQYGIANIRKIWTREYMWVSRNEHGVIIRAEERPPKLEGEDEG
ncbi:MAG: hypothetical protein K0R28_2688 [Paenibacillus sp.]|jgi:hypothetical protein|nr:hypothetical protein [Paenibacillus sp.]